MRDFRERGPPPYLQAAPKRPIQNSVRNRDQNNLESMKDEFVLDYIHLLYYKCNKINPNRGGSYIDSNFYMLWRFLLAELPVFLWN